MPDSISHNLNSINQLTTDSLSALDSLSILDSLSSVISLPLQDSVTNVPSQEVTTGMEGLILSLIHI